MRRLPLLFILPLFFLWAADTVTAQKAYKKLSTAKQLQDFAIFKTALLESHAGLYAYNDSVEFERKFERMEEQLGESRTLLDLYALYAKIISEIQCGHTSIHHKKLFYSYSRNLNAYLPFEIYPVNNKVLVKQSFCPDRDCPRKYDRILAIDRQPVSELLEELFRYIPSDGNNTTFKLEACKRDFNKLLFLHKGERSSYSVTFVNQFNDTITSIIETVSPPKKADKKNYDFTQRSELIKFLPEQGIAILTPPAPLPRDRFYFSQLQDFFTVLTDYEVENLIIDLRNNLGGLSQDLLASFLADSNYVYVENSMKGSGAPSYKEYIKGKLSLNFLTLKMFSLMAPAGNLGANTIYVKAREKKYKGRVFVLTNGLTFSAASNLASNLKEKSGAIIVGKETGGGYRYCNSGNLVLQLPYSKFRITINPIKFDNQPRNKYYNDGVMPHLEIPEDEKFDREEDLQLLFLIKMIQNL